MPGQSGGPGTQFIWTKWSDNQAISHVVAPTSNRNFQATFKRQFFLTMNAGSGGAVQPASGWQDANQAVTIKAHANPGFHFVNWTGSGSGSYTGPNSPATINMNAPITETGNFAKSNYVYVGWRHSRGDLVIHESGRPRDQLWR